MPNDARGRKQEVGGGGGGGVGVRKSFQAAVEQVPGDHRQHSATAGASRTSPCQQRTVDVSSLRTCESPLIPLHSRPASSRRCTGKNGARVWGDS